MKKIFILPFLLLLGCASTDQVTNLENRVSVLENYISQLESRIEENEFTTNNLSSNLFLQHGNLIRTDSSEQVKILTTPKQCKAITKAGSQCKRNPKEGSDYCWQHQGNSKINPTEKSSSYSGNKTIYTGPRGGQYYINSKGNKTYIKRKK